jgi:hypothetical protein
MLRVCRQLVLIMRWLKFYQEYADRALRKCLIEVEIKDKFLRN